MSLKIKIVVLSLVSFVGFTSSVAQEATKAFNPPLYIAQKADYPIEIDGSGADEAWNKVQWSQLFIDIEGNQKPTYDTRVKMLWDEHYFYIIASMEEPHVWGDIVDRDAVIFLNNDFEVFVDPDGDTHNYYELEINALNTVWDLFINKPYREKNHILNDWDMKGLKSAVKVNGTLNDHSDIDQGWVLEMAIPWTVYKTSYYEKVLPVDHFWRVNFSRVNWDHEIVNNQYQRKKGGDGKHLPEYNWVWSPTGVINIHLPEKWGYVYFATDQTSIDQVSIPLDEQLKWKLFEFYRFQKQYYNNHNQWSKKLPESSIEIDGKKINFTLEFSSIGWTITTLSPFTQTRFTIQNEGRLITN